MSRYKRLRAEGGTYFFTVNLAQRGSRILTDHILDLRAAVATVRNGLPFEIDAMVVLPDHLHAIWTLPDGDADFSTRWKNIKTLFTKRTGLAGAQSASKQRQGEKGLWQRRFWEHLIRGDADYAAHIRYCWGNPVKHGLTRSAVEWPYSSIHRDVRLGRVPPEWRMPDGGYFGE